MYDVELIAGDLWRSQATYTGALEARGCYNLNGGEGHTTLLLATELK